MRSTLLPAFALSFALGILGLPAAQAQTWPAKPIRIVVPFSPGGFADSSARYAVLGIDPVGNKPDEYAAGKVHGQHTSVSSKRTSFGA